jgi:hypothetical protein
MHSRLVQMNENSEIEEEKVHLTPTKPPLELSTIYERTIDQYSFIQIDTVFYSMPEALVGKKVIVKKYHDEIRVYYNNVLVCKHERLFGCGKLQVDITHYLETLHKKPGAIKNSAVLKGIPRLKAIFDTHYVDKPRKFIEVFMENKGLSLKEMVALFEEKTKNTLELNALDVVKPPLNEEAAIRANMVIYTALINVGIQKKQNGDTRRKRTKGGAFV